jgi:hypothetical protein
MEGLLRWFGRGLLRQLIRRKRQAPRDEKAELGGEQMQMTVEAAKGVLEGGFEP